MTEWILQRAESATVEELYAMIFAAMYQTCTEYVPSVYQWFTEREPNVNVNVNVNANVNVNENE